MSVKLIQNFEYLENFSLNGNAAISAVHKFGNKSVAFSGAGDSVAVSNNSGLFNIYQDTPRNFECFFYPYYDFDNNNNNYGFFNGHSFKLFHSDNISWHDAKSYCENMGGHLATFTSKDKNDFLANLANGNNIWLGGSDEVSEGNWRWITGEDWSYSNWDYGQGYQEPNDANHTDNYAYMYGANGRWNDCPNIYNVNFFICEWDYDFSQLGFIPGYIFNFDNGLSLELNQNAALRLLAPSVNIDAPSAVTVSADTWHYISLRVNNGFAQVYLDGNLVISAPCQNINISPTIFSLGGFSGYIDEFAVSDDADSPTSIPTRHFEAIRRKSSAPVKFAVWSCNNLPDGLTLSESGVLSGTPTVTGTFNCNISLNTNWGTANKSIRIVIN